jgi:DNA-binding MarR family transcriptional regulator
MAQRRQPAYGSLLAFQVTSTADAIRRGTALQMRREHDMSLAQVRVLAYIEALQPVRLREVAADAGADKAQISRVVTSLVERGYVARQALAGDARSAHLELTEAGRLELKAIFQSLSHRDRMLLAMLQPSEVDRLVDLLARLRGAADEIARGEESLEGAQPGSASEAA